MAVVLIVDDLNSEAQLMGRVVTSLGHRPEFAGNGEDALAKVREVRPALVLMDVVMPKRDGFSTCRKLKRDEETAGIPVVLVTSKNQQSDKFWGEKQGADGYIVKPFSPDELAAAIRRHVAETETKP